ncbi:MAG TPA: hypothetical protein VJJ82_01305 [Candidatus Nanoarchaeia archaeon]|nr:hypothetical protein [Candidatus Nanoarchaeia archaeon]
MATPLDITVLQQFSGIFPFLLILVLVYVVLSQMEWFKDKTSIAAIIAVLVALMSLLSPVVTKSVSLMAPWFVLFIIFIVLLMLGYMTIGIKKDVIVDFVQKDTLSSALWIFAIIAIIGIGSIASVWTDETGGLEKLQGKNLTAQVESGNADRFQAIFHPKVLGVALVLLVGFFTIKYMTSID